MNSTEAAVPTADAATRVVAYEQPLNERMRNFLRLDFLYQQAVHHHTLPDPWSTRAAVSSLLEILAITQRGDIRSEVLKELERQMHHLSAFSSRPGVDSARLKLLLTKLHRMREELSSIGALFMQKLRDSEFLNAIKHRSTIPGGTCEFDLPAYFAWQQLDPERRRADLGTWAGSLTPLSEALHALMDLLRDSGAPQRMMASGGQYQQSLPQNKNYHLMRVRFDDSGGLVPEISGHRLLVSIRMMRADTEGRLRPLGMDVPFELTLCA